MSLSFQQPSSNRRSWRSVATIRRWREQKQARQTALRFERRRAERAQEAQMRQQQRAEIEDWKFAHGRGNLPTLRWMRQVEAHERYLASVQPRNAWRELLEASKYFGVHACN